MANCGKHYKCVTSGNFTGVSSAIVLGLLSGSLIILDVIIAVVAGSAIPILGVIAAGVFIAAVFELCAFLSGGKLICLGDSSCTIGRIMELIPVGQDKSGFEKMDDDYTMNTLPSPHSPIEKASEIAAINPVQGKYLVAQSGPTNLGLGFKGVSVTFPSVAQPGGGTASVTADVFHVEVKGCRVHDVCIALKIMSFGSAVVAVICSIPVIGWIVCAIAAAIWLAITAGIAAIAWAATHVGDINDVLDPGSGTLVPADAKTGEGGDVILVRGDWVYDAGHDGWNEIQPIVSVHKLTDVVDPRYRGMAKADQALVDGFNKEVYDVWCRETGKASDPLVIGEQKQPRNKWHIHPDIDGCRDDQPPQGPA